MPDAQPNPNPLCSRGLQLRYARWRGGGCCTYSGATTRPWRVLCFACLFCMQFLVQEVGSSGVNANLWRQKHGKFSNVIIPGFGSVRMRSWSMMDCPLSPVDVYPLDPIWVDTSKVLSIPNCWLKCMLLDPYNQTDNPECKIRPDSGILAITEMDPGYITGPLSSVWKEWIHWCVEFGIDPDAIVATPYDWRLSGSMLEQRDLYFHKLKITFETLLKHRGGPSIVFAHSMGNNVFRYFLEWLKTEIPPEFYLNWIDDHIHAYYAVGAAFLGSVETVKAILSGINFGIPITEGTARIMSNSFSSVLWMLPFSKYCSDHLLERDHQQDHDLHRKEHQLTCDANEYCTNFSGWPVDIVKVDMPVAPKDESPMVNGDCSIPFQRSFSAHEVSKGTFFQEIADFDPESEKLLYQLNKYYLNDPILNPLTPWERPPIKNVYCIYGINLKTEVGYHFAPSGKSYPDNWIITDIMYEVEGGSLHSRSGSNVDGNPGPASGDNTVPYYSLSWCKSWLGSRVNITRTPQNAHNGSDVQEIQDVEHERGTDIFLKMPRDSKKKYITYYEDSISLAGKKTAVWELDKADHRNLVRSPILIREMWLETLHSLHPESNQHFFSKAMRTPLRDEDCYWDYAKTRCSFPKFCEYRYVFGDVHLGQSCRLKASSSEYM